MDSPCVCGVDSSESDRVHLPVGFVGCHEEKKWKEKMVKTFCGRREERKGKESSVMADNIQSLSQMLVVVRVVSGLFLG